MQRQLIEEAKELKRNVKAFNQQEARQGGLIKAPYNTEDLLRAALPVLKDIRDGINQLVDIQRYRVCTLSSCHTIMLTCCNRLVSIPSSQNLTTLLRLLAVLVSFPLLLSYSLWLLLLLFRLFVLFVLPALLLLLSVLDASPTSRSLDAGFPLQDLLVQRCLAVSH
jgi:hypothetical protein